MKQWFKYGYGYVNIDSENLYFTSSGNWKETEELEEKTVRVQSKNTARTLYFSLYLVAAIGLMAFLVFKNIVNGKVSLGLFAILGFGGYKLFQYMRTELGAKFKIPLGKISEIKIFDQTAEIKFENGESEVDSHTLQNIETRGLEILEEMQTTLSSKTY